MKVIKNSARVISCKKYQLKQIYIHGLKMIKKFNTDHIY